MTALARLEASQRSHEALGGRSAELQDVQEANEAALNRVIDGVRQVHGWLTAEVAEAGAADADDLLAKVTADLEVDEAELRRAAQRRAKAAELRGS